MRICKRLIVPVFAALITTLVSGRSLADKLHDYPISPVAFTDVTVSDGLWLQRIETNRRVTIPYDFRKCEETGRIANFEIAAGMKKGKHEGFWFNDSDVFKVMEGAAYSLALHDDEQLAKYLDGLIAKIAGAQQDDGYPLYNSHDPRQRTVSSATVHGSRAVVLP